MRKSKNEKYFAEREEQAVFDFILEPSDSIRNDIYNKILLKPFKKMIESILRRYPIHIGNYDIKEVEANALSHLIEHMIKYRPFIIEWNKTGSEKWTKLPMDYRFFYVEDANEMLKSLIEQKNSLNYRIFFSKAFSYCQTIIRNFYKDHSKKSYNEKKANTNYDDYAEEINNERDYQYEMDDNEKDELENIIKSVIKKIETRLDTDTQLKRNEFIVGDAIINVLKNWHLLFLEDTPEGKYNKKITNKFAKNKILLYFKEQTGLSTKEIRLSIKPFKELYNLEKLNFFNK
jgi:hypothetical protein